MLAPLGSRVVITSYNPKGESLFFLNQAKTKISGLINKAKKSL
jgi:hypothetical protein